MSIRNCWQAIGFNKADSKPPNITSAGAMTLEGAPHLRNEHLPESSIAPIRAAKFGKRYLSVESHIRMVASDAFIFGAISRPSICQMAQRVEVEGKLHAVLALALKGQCACTAMAPIVPALNAQLLKMMMRIFGRGRRMVAAPLAAPAHKLHGEIVKKSSSVRLKCVAGKTHIAARAHPEGNCGFTRSIADRRYGRWSPW